MKYDDINEVKNYLAKAQDAERDQRKQVRETHEFLTKRDGQWDPRIITRMGNRPRGTFDKCNPIVDGIAGNIEEADFDIKVRPLGGEASKEIAMTYDGLIRNIEASSNASKIYSRAAREMVAAGLGGWEVCVDWVSNNSFDQDFEIKFISNFEDKVWFDPGAVEQDMSDAKYCYVLENLMPDEYKKRFPEGSAQSIGVDRTFDSYTYKPEFITVGRFLYKKYEKRKLFLMSDGSVYEDDEEFQQVKDDLEAQGITIQNEREREYCRVYSRVFDGGDFLTEEEETVFSYLPIIPIYGNFGIREGKITYWGAVEKLIDAQRYYNYARSREMEDVALSPPDVTWATRQQLSVPADRNAAMNMSVSPQRVYTYTPDPENPGPPVRTGGPTVSPGLQQAIQNSIDDMQTSSARAPLQGGDIEQSLSGVAINAINSRADTTTIKYFIALQIAISHTGCILVDAIPRLYDSTARRRIIGQDQGVEMVDINKTIIDMETRQPVTLNDLSQGQYDVYCDMGKSFANRQQEAVETLNELYKVIPGLAEITADINLKNITAPGVDLAAERVRAQLVQNNAIPFNQLTDEEKAQAQAAEQAAMQQPEEPTPEDKIAEAEIARVQAETQDVLARAQLKQEELRIKEQKDLLEAQNKAEKLAMEELTMFMKQQQQQVENQNSLIEASFKGQQAIIDQLATQAETLKTLKDAIGVDAVIGPQVAEVYADQVDLVQSEQKSQTGEDII